MQFLNKKAQRFVQEKIPWEVRVPYAKQTSPKKMSQVIDLVLYQVSYNLF